VARARHQPAEHLVAEAEAAERSTWHRARFAVAKFRPASLPATLLTRSALHERLAAGAGRRLALVVGPAGAGKTVLLSSWAASRPPGLTSWLSCDRADTDPVRFWSGFIGAAQAGEPWFGADAASMLALDGVVSADVIASIANDAAKLPAGSAIVVDDFQHAAGSAAGDMTDLVERWPAETVQLVLAGRFDPPLRLHRLRLDGDLCELRDHDLSFTLPESRDLLANFGVGVGAGELALLHQRTEGWAAGLQMAALSLRGAADPVRVARALDFRSDEIGGYFVSEVLEQQPSEVARFMLDIAVFGVLTAGACAAVTGRRDAAALLHGIDAAGLFLVAVDDERTSFRYHHLVRQVLRAELRARDPAREQALHMRAARWFESAGETRQAAHHFLAARQVDRALAVLQDQVVTDFLRAPVPPIAPDLSVVNASLLAGNPDRLLALATDLLLSGDVARGGEYLGLLERTRPSISAGDKLEARLECGRALRCMLIGQAEQAVAQALAARAIRERVQLQDEWAAAIPLILQSAYTWLEDYEAVEREAATALAMPELAEAVTLVQVPGARALAWLEAGHLARAASAAAAAAVEAGRLGFGQHFFAVDYLRTLAGLALERRDLDAAERLTEQALSISTPGRPACQFLALLDQAGIWAARGQVRDALAGIETARLVLAGTGSVLLARADELEAAMRLSLDDPRTPAELAARLPGARRALLLAQIALADGDHHTAQQHLQPPPGQLTPRRALVRQLLLAGAAISRGDPLAAGILTGALQAARQGGFCHTLVTTTPQVTSYLIEHATPAHPDPFTDQLIAAALNARAAQPAACGSRRPAEPLTAAELRVLKLLPTSTYLQIAAALYISRSTVKTHLQSVYLKLGAASRSQAIERAVDLRLL
jgi:LuxR family maltose regulon positive regulatory protein